MPQTFILPQEYTDFLAAHTGLHIPHSHPHGGREAST